MNSQPRIPVVYVVGSSHSGTTILALLADSHPSMASVGETAVKRRIRHEGRTREQRCSCGALLAECTFWLNVFTDVTAKGVPFGPDRWSVDYRFEHPWMDALFTRETSVDALRTMRRLATRHVPIMRQRTQAIDRANVAFVSAVLRRRNARVFLDATKLVTRLLHLLELPQLDVRVVHVVRDVRAVAASAQRRGASAVEAAAVWKADQLVIAKTLRKRPALPSLLVRYEELCRTTTQTLSSLWSFAGVEPVDVPANVTPANHHVLGNSLRLRGSARVALDDAWRRTLDAPAEQSVWTLAGELCQSLGYER